MVSLYYLYVSVDIDNICYNWLLYVVVVIVLFIWLPFCYVIVHQNICCNSSFLVAKFLCHRRWQLETLFSLYISDAIVSLIVNQILSINSTTTTTTTIQQSHHQSMSGLSNVKSDRPLCFANDYRTTLNTLFLLLSPFFLYGQYSCNQQPHRHLHLLTCYITIIFSLSHL